MWYLVGLGNPGEKYKNTRHNVGWAVLDQVREQNSFSSLHDSGEYGGQVATGVINTQEVIMLYPATYMNNSGAAVKKLVGGGDTNQLIIVHDDIDLPFGEIKVVVGRGAGGNNGVASIIEALKTNEFVRVRVGIAPRSIFNGEVKRPKGGGPLERFVLKPFSGSEAKKLPEVIDRAATAIAAIVKDGPAKAMNANN